MAGMPTRHDVGGLSRTVLLFTVTSFFADVSTEMLVPILPIFLTQTLHALGSAVGWIEGIAGATQNLAQGLSGTLSDRLRRRKPVALAGYLCSAIGKPVMGLASVWPGVLAGRFIDRLGAGTRSAPRDALIAGSVDDAHRGKAFGLEGVGDNAGACVGPLLALLLISVFQLPMRALFYVAVIPGFLAFLLVLPVDEARTRTTAKAAIDVRPWRLPRIYGRYLLATAVFGIGNSSNAFLILETRDIGVSLTNTMLVYSGFNFVAALASYPAGWLSDHWGRRNLLLLAFTIFLVTYAGFAWSRSPSVVCALFLAYGLFQGIYRSVGKALASDLVATGLHASAIGWFSATVGLSGLVASVVAGMLWDRAGHPAVFLFGAVSALAGIVAAMVLIEPAP